MYRFALLTAVVHLCVAEEPLCHTQTEPGKTIYRVKKEANTKALDCEYSWNNDMETVLANSKEHDRKIVLSSTDTLLVALTCIEKVIYRHSCVSRKPPYNCTCVVNCTEALENHSIKDSSSLQCAWIITGVVLGWLFE